MVVRCSSAAHSGRLPPAGWTPHSIYPAGSAVACFLPSVPMPFGVTNAASRCASMAAGQLGAVNPQEHMRFPGAGHLSVRLAVSPEV
jgi:hypothetical protein